MLILALFIIIVIFFIVILLKNNREQCFIKNSEKKDNKRINDILIKTEQEIQKSNNDNKKYTRLTDYLKIIILALFVTNCSKEYVKMTISQENITLIEKRMKLINEVENRIKTNDFINYTNGKACIDEKTFIELMQLMKLYKLTITDFYEIIKLYY